MKKFGFGKKKEDRSANASPAASNPYAAPQAAADPYAQDTNKYAGMPSPSPYMNAKLQYGPPGATPSGRPGLPGGPGSMRSGISSATAPPQYEEEQQRGPPQQSGYGADRYGNGGGYGADRYGGAPSRGPSGYGGLGRTNSVDTTNTEDNRDALFGDAKSRYVQKAQQPPPEDSQAGGGYGASGSGSGGYGGGYGEERQLTAEEEEEEDVQATKQQIRFMKQEDVSSTRNALRIAQQAEETGRATLARLGAQGERIHNTEKNLDLAANHNRIAEEKAKELKTLNKSMFAVHVSNPFTASQRRAAREDDILNKHRAEREARDETRRDAFGTQQRMDANFRELGKADGYKPKTMTKASLAERSKYQFEADSDDEEMENEIDSNLDALSGAAGRLNMLAKATGEEVERQNDVLDRVARKVCLGWITMIKFYKLTPVYRRTRLMIKSQ